MLIVVVAFLVLTVLLVVVDSPADDSMGVPVIFGFLCLATAVWLIALAAMWIGANLSSPPDLKTHVVSPADERILRTAETALRLDSSPEFRQLDLQGYRAHCLEVRRASALITYDVALEEYVDDFADIAPWEHLDFRDVPVQGHGLWHPLRPHRAVWPDIGSDAEGPLVRLADTLLAHDTDRLNALLDNEMEPPPSEATLQEHDIYRSLRTAAATAMADLAHADTVLDGGPDPDGLCPRSAGRSLVVAEIPPAEATNEKK